MLVASGVCPDEESAHARLTEALESGRGLAKLKEMIRAQGGDDRVCDDVSLLPQAPLTVPVIAEKAGYLSQMDTAALGNAAQAMGAGRRTKEDVIDPAVGIVMRKRLGDLVAPGDTLATLYARTEESAQAAAAAVREALVFSETPAKKPKLIFAVVTPDGIRKY